MICFASPLITLLVVLVVLILLINVLFNRILAKRLRRMLGCVQRSGRA